MNNYHIHEIIGRSRASKVYKARLKQSLEYVAVKACAKDAKPRVLQEVKVLNSMTHPHMLRFHTWYETQNHLWVILEYCVGGDLLALLRSDGQLPEPSVLRLGRDLASAVMHLHSRGILHCDLKPSNLLLDESGRVRLGGLGISRRFEVVQRQLATLPAGLREMQQGSPYYLAPEVVRTPGLYTSASDLWALGCILYECAAGRPPFAASTTQQLNALIVGSHPPTPHGISPELVGLISRLLDKDPLQRCTWPELCSHPFWGASPPAVLSLPEEPVLAKLQEEAEAHAEGEYGSESDGAARHRASGTGSSLGGDAEFATAGVAQGALLAGRDSTRSSGSGNSGGGSSSNLSGEYARGANGAAQPPPPQQQQQQQQQLQQQHPEGTQLQRAGSGDSYPTSAPAAGPPQLPASAGAAADDGYPGATPAHPRTMARTAGMPQPAAAGAPADASAAARLATQFAGLSPPGGGPRPSAPVAQPAAGLGGGGGGGVLPPSSLESLIYHPTDGVMKPIVGNKRIERPLEGLFNPSLLPFQPLPASQVAAMPDHAKAAFVGALTRTISGAAHPHTKLATLVYCESMCGDAAMVGDMLNGDMGPALVQLLDLSGKDPALRLRAANLLGLLIRHAASISPALAAAGASEALAAAMRQPQDPALQRRAAAALGELLFYADSQNRSGSSSGGREAGGGSGWDLSAEAVATLAAQLALGQDAVAQHYAAKALENVFGLGGPWAQQLATAETLERLAQLVDSRLPDVLRGTAASALCRLLRCQPGCLPTLVEVGGVDLIAAGLTDGSPRVQQAAVTVLCQLLCSRQLAPGVTELCLANEAVLDGLSALLDNAAEMLQAKALVALALLCRTSTGLACVVGWHGLLHQVERLCSRERLQGGGSGGGSGGVPGSEQYMAAAVAALTQQMAANVVPLLRQAAAAARAGGSAGGSSGSSGEGALAPLEALLLLLGSTSFRPVVVCDGLISGLADLLTRSVSSAGSSGASQLEQDVKVHVLDAIDAVCSHPELLIEHYAVVLSTLLPSLSAAVASQRESADTRFCCLKLLCDVVLQFVNEPRLYLSATASEHTTADSGIANKAIDGAVAQYVLPLVPALLSDEDPMPLYALKLLGALLEFNRAWVAEVAAAGLAGRFFEWLSIAHPHNNVHNLRLCRLVAEAKVLPAQALASLEAIDRVLAVLAYAHENDVEPFLEPAAHLLAALLNDVGPSESQKAVGALPLLLELAGGAESEVAVAAAHGALKLLHLHPGDTAEARPALLRDHGDVLRPAVSACLEAIGDPGLRRRWAPLLRPS
ncbi:serine threonine-kinase ULK4 isoform B [Micractinium conductrix]|uniref:Serine threonine-kinase ULK4 isoform B n=1 Tax=Micractinium conductrix TaxID=554055 RepID=A0A2P6V1P7_9CHLO|nr:serine threonine-kinase ULK4 isoform B [Micractinium conductrix]|eukprot:PSC68021.1 serine threonine-kinase ULK4 isoform B [Micractinium conductrix]